MKYYTWLGETTTKLPNSLKLENGDTVSPVSEALFESLGGVITEDELPTHMEEFEAALAVFRQVCADIGIFVSDPDFRGGINEMDVLATSQAAQENPVTALILSQRWNGANLACNHLANKDDVNMPSPEWWYYCWEEVDAHAESEEA